MTEEYPRNPKREYFDKDDYEYGRTGRKKANDYKNFEEDEKYYENRNKYDKETRSYQPRNYESYRYDEGRRNDYNRKTIENRDIGYYRGTEQEYSHRKSGYEEYNKRQKIENRTQGNIESFYREKTKTKHVPADPNCTIGVFGFNPHTTDEDLKRVFQKKLKGMTDYTYKLIMDERTNLCKGYCFIHFGCLDDAITAKEILSTESFRGQDFKCDYSYKHGILGE